MQDKGRAGTLGSRADKKKIAGRRENEYSEDCRAKSGSHLNICFASFAAVFLKLMISITARLTKPNRESAKRSA